MSGQPIDDETVRVVYAEATQIQIERLGGYSLDVGKTFCLYPDLEGRWVVGRRWSTIDPMTGLVAQSVGPVEPDDGGGVFSLFETALRVALSLEFEERMCQAFSTLGDIERARIEMPASPKEDP